MTDAELLAEIDAAFGEYPKLEHFTDFGYCEQCANHDQVLRSRGRGELRTEDVSNPGWNPICFDSAEAFFYLFSELVRVSLLSTKVGEDRPFPALHFHLTYEADQNHYFQGLSPLQRTLVVKFLRHIAAMRRARFEDEYACDKISPTTALWESGVQPCVQRGPLPARIRLRLTGQLAKFVRP